MSKSIQADLDAGTRRASVTQPTGARSRAGHVGTTSPDHLSRSDVEGALDLGDGYVIIKLVETKRAAGMAADAAASRTGKAGDSDSEILLGF